ncbi:hypothetical protein L7F22_062834 [Adiantum nelumboides]|nr:hypothetical protein [Adiantum nelumboides]
MPTYLKRWWNPKSKAMIEALISRTYGIGFQAMNRSIQVAIKNTWHKSQSRAAEPLNEQSISPKASSNILCGLRVLAILGQNNKAPRSPKENTTPEEKKALKDWKQGKSKVMYWLSMSVSDSMMGYLESAPSLAIAWKSLENLNEDHTKVKKLQLKIELNTVKQSNMSINDYASKIKTITNSLGSIGVTIDNDDVVASMLEGLGIEYKNFKSSMNTRADVPDFTELTTMLICEENSLSVGASSSQSNISSNQQAFYSNRGRVRGCGTGGGHDDRHQICSKIRVKVMEEEDIRGGNQNASRDQNIASNVKCWTG